MIDKENRSFCRLCGSSLVIMEEPRQSYFLNRLQNIKVLFLVPLLECPKCKWNFHYGKPLNVTEVTNALINAINS